MNIEAGRLRHRITLQAPRDLLDSNGDVIQNQETGEVARVWEDVATVWAAIEPLSAREFIAAQAVQSKVTTKIIIRHREVDASWRALHVRGILTTVYNIHGVIPDPDSMLEWITLPCSSGVSFSGQ